MKTFNTQKKVVEHCNDCPFLKQPSGTVLGYDRNPIGTEDQENECCLNLFNATLWKKVLKNKKLVTKMPLELDIEYQGISLDDGLNPKKTKLCIAFTKYIINNQ